MDGKIFLRADFTPHQSPQFVFDLQRFDDNAVCKIDNTEYTSLQDAVTAAKTGDTIEMLADVNLGDTGWIYIYQKEITLDLKGKIITTNSTCVFMVSPRTNYYDNNTKDKNIESTSLTINNTGGDNSGTKGSIISNAKGWAVIVIGDGNENHAPSLTVNGGYIKSGDCGISGLGNDGSNGRDDRYINITINDGNIIGGNPVAKGCGLYFPGMGSLKINGGTITGGTGVEIRAGSLEVTGGTIQAGSFDNEGKFVPAKESSFTPNGNGSSSVGVGLAVSQHTTKKKIEVNVSGNANISGAVALAVDNPQNNAAGVGGEIGVEINGGTFESTAAGTAAIAAQNADERVSIKVKKATFKGALESTFATTGTGDKKSAAIEITGEVTVETKNENGETVVTKYDSTSLQYKVIAEGEADKYETVSKGWNKIQATGDWLYLEAKSGSVTEAEAKATLAPATGDAATTTLNLTTSGLTTLALDMTADLFKDLTYTTIDASTVTLPVAITGNAQVTSILGGTSNDTLTAISTAGVSLNGGTGDDSLIGGTGKDTFIYSASGNGNDRIRNYDIANDIVSLGNGLTAPTSFGNVAFVNNSNYIISLGGGVEGDSLTFESTSKLSIVDSQKATYSYTTNTISKKESAATVAAITLGAAYTSNFDASKGDNADYATIDASAVTAKIKITGNDKPNSIIGGTGGGTLLGGAGADTLEAKGGETTLVGGSTSTTDSDEDLLIGSSISGSKDTFIYNGGADSIRNYGDGDLVTMKAAFNPANATFSVSGGNVSISFADSNDKLIFESIGSGQTISLKSGRNTYLYKNSTLALGKSITLMSGFTANSFSAGETYNTINAAAVTDAISITGNNNGNYIAIGKSGGSLTGGTGNDTFIGGAGKDIFNYAGGKDVIVGFDTADSLSITGIDKITKARASSSKLVFTKDKDNTITFKENDSGDVAESINVANGGYLTKDGFVSGNNFTLFGSAKGRIDLTDSLYSISGGITSVNAAAVEKQGVTLVGGTQGGSFQFAANKKRDTFEYNGGKVSISGFESGKDRLNLGNYTISAFSVGSGSKGDVAVSLKSGEVENHITLTSAAGSEFRIHQDGVNKGNSYSKMVFADKGVLHDKGKNPTSAILWANATGYNANDYKTVRKITVGGGVSGISIQASNTNNTAIDASLANGVSLYSGAKNDKFTGGKDKVDMFVYTAGKDIIQNFGTTDLISLGSGLELDTAKITTNKNSIKFKFNKKNALTIKAEKGSTLSGSLNINGVEHTYYKNAIADSSGTVSLTSEFSGTYKIGKDADGIKTVDGHLVAKKLTIKGTTSAESLTGGIKKTTFKGGGGADTLVGGSGEDIFFYAKGDSGTSTIQNFDFSNDKLKIANGTLKKVSVVGAAVQFDMKKGKSIDDPAVGNFKLDSYAKYKKENGKMVKDITFSFSDASKVLIKANNTYYWFAKDDVTEPVTTEGADGKTVIVAKAGDLITWDKKVTSSDIKGNTAVIELDYSTNLVRAGVATAVSKTNAKNNGIPK